MKASRQGTLRVERKSRYGGEKRTLMLVLVHITLLVFARQDADIADDK